MVGRESNNTAFIEGEKRITYHELYELASKMSQKIEKMDIYPSPVGLFLPNCIEYVIGYFAIALTGNVIVPIRPQSTFFEVCKIVEHCEIKVVITLSNMLPIFQAHENLCSSRLAILCVDNFKFYILNPKKEFYKPSCDLTIQDENSVALFLQTSGTTSSSKTVMLSHKNLISNIYAAVYCYKLNENDVTLIQMPLQLVSGNIQMLSHVAVGATCVLNNRLFSPKLYFRLLERHRVTHFSCVPYMLQSLLESCDLSLLNSLQFIVVGATKTPVDLLKVAMERNKNITFVNSYGQTEASPCICYMMMKGKSERVGSVGKEIPGVTVEIRDQFNQLCAPREPGIIFVKGENVMKGYFKNSSATQHILKDGWLNTGDIGMKDEEGFLYIKGREKNLIISNGSNIYPEEVEDVLLQFPGVKEALVYGVPHPDYQEIPEAKIVVSREISINMLQKFCLNRLSAYKTPRKFYICDSLEKTSNGKIKREGIEGPYGHR